MERYWIVIERDRERKKKQDYKHKIIYYSPLTSSAAPAPPPLPLLNEHVRQNSFSHPPTLEMDAHPERPSSVKGHLIAVKIRLSGCPDLNPLTEY